MYGIMIGLYQAHRKGIMHRDLKSKHVMFDDENYERVKIRGFSTIIATKKYAEKSMKEDVFAAGEIFFLLITGKSVKSIEEK